MLIVKLIAIDSRLEVTQKQPYSGHSKRQITKRAEAQNGRSTKRQKAQNGRSSKRQKHKTAAGTKRQKLKTAEGTKQQKAQNGRKHKTANDFYILIFILRFNVLANGQFLLQ
jgi:hypothetical protein